MSFDSATTLIITTELMKWKMFVIVLQILAQFACILLEYRK